MLLEDIIDLVKIYVDCSGEEVLPAVLQMCICILAEENNSDEAQHLVKKWEEINFIMRQRIMTKILTYLHPHLNSKEYAKRFH